MGAGTNGRTGAGADATTATGWGRHGRWPIALLASIGLVDGVDRGILGGVLTLIQEDLGFSDAQLGLLETSYVIAGLLLAVPAGYLSDRRRRTRILSVVLGAWAVISAATAAVRTYVQMFVVRAALGGGQIIDDPASQSLISDYYPARIRGRAYAYQRVTPTVGRALGLGLGAVVGAAVGWRGAFLLVGIPGSLIAVALWRLPEPVRGASDRAPGPRPDPAPDPDPVPEPAGTAPGAGWHLRPREMLADLREALAVPSFRNLFLGTAVNSATLQTLAFWGVAYWQRTAPLDPGLAGSMASVVILIGALGGSLAGGLVSDRVRERTAGGPMLLAAWTTAAAAVVIFVSFLEGIPVLTVRLPLQMVGVALVVGALPATTAMTSEVVRADLRSTAFALVRLGGTLMGAVVPPVIGLLADRLPYTTPRGEVVGDLGQAFLYVVPVLLVGAWLYHRGYGHVEADRAAVLEAAREG